MTKELIKENIEGIKFKKWQDQTKVKVQEAVDIALVKISILRKSFKDE